MSILPLENVKQSHVNGNIKGMTEWILDHVRDRISLQDVRALLRLCNALHKAHADGPQRKRKLLQGLRQLTSADRASATVVAFGGSSTAPPVIVSAVHSGRRNRAANGSADAEAYRKYSHRWGSDAWPTADWCTTSGSLSRRSALRGGSDGGDCVHSFLPLPGSRALACLTLVRNPGRPPFSSRDRSLACAFHAEAGWIYRTDVMLASPETRSLSPRERQTLQHLLAGKAEKQIALELALSYNTVHHYVKALHKHFRVSSRSELLARWVGR